MEKNFSRFSIQDRVNIKMSIISLKQNVKQEIEIINNLLSYYGQLESFSLSDKEKEMTQESVDAFLAQLRIINKAIPQIIENISFELKDDSEKEKGLIDVKYKESRNYVTIDEEHRKEFLLKLNLSAQALKRIKKAKKIEVSEEVDFKKPSAFARYANRLFFKNSDDLSKTDYFKMLGEDLRKANMHYLLKTYISIMLLTTLITLFIAVLVWVFFIFFSISLESPFVFLQKGNFLSRIITNIWIVFVLPLIVFFSFFFYPKTEKVSLGNKIDQEMPFVTIHMSAIAGSGIEPSQIFKIIAFSKEYPYTREEVKKIINQINVYGFDLVNALKNTARATASNKLADLLNGLATTISTGGSLSNFLDKRAETLLFTYKLERDKFIRVAETFMDIYISVVISAPMLMMILLVLMKVTGAGIGLSVGGLSLVMILIISFINVIFLVFLNLKQPRF